MKQILLQKDKKERENLKGKIIITIPDDNCNIINGFGKVFTYDSRNDLIEINDSLTNIPIARYFYNPNHQRIKKVTYNINSGGHNATTYYPFQEFVHTRITNGTIFNETYIYLYDKPIAKVNQDGSKFFYHPDHLDSTSLVTNESGDVVENVFYLPFGKVLIGTSEERFLYTGKEWDKESELLYYGARYYDPEFSRFLQADPVISDVYNPQNLNRYSYVLNNPYKYTDPNGENPLLAVGLVAGVVVGAIQGIITYQQTGDLNKAVTSGIIGGGATALTVATLGAASVTTATAGSGLRYIAATGASKFGAGLFSGAVGAGESIAQQILVGGKSAGDISFSDVAISATANSLSTPVFEAIGARGIITRGSGTFYPSAIGTAFGKEVLSQTAQSGYSELGEFGIKKLLNDEISLYQNQPSSQQPIQEEWSNRKFSSQSSGGGGFGSSAPPPNQYSTPIGGCGVVMNCF